MRIGLVLGAGGVMGGAWLTGGLEALARRTGWDPSSADHVVGTSAGAMIGALNAAGVPPWFMVAHSAGEVFDGLVDADGRPAAEADRSAGAVFRLQRELPRLGPGSWRLGLAALRSPTRHTPAAAITAWLPRGVISTEPLQQTVRRVVPIGWADHPGLWVVATDLVTGRRTVFGADGAPLADLADAVAASCAIPGFYSPVRIGGREYVDGGVCSASNLDVLRERDLDLVICLNPTSTRDEAGGVGPVERVAAGLRRAAGRRLGHEARKLVDAGVEVLLIQPTARDRAAMGTNLMGRRRRHSVVETAIETVGAQLDAPGTRELVRDLPPGDPDRVRRPSGPPETWPRPGRRSARR